MKNGGVELYLCYDLLCVKIHKWKLYIYAGICIGNFLNFLRSNQRNY